jgi:hypothetical protein
VRCRGVPERGPDAPGLRYALEVVHHERRCLEVPDEDLRPLVAEGDAQR